MPVVATNNDVQRENVPKHSNVPPAKAFVAVRNGARCDRMSSLMFSCVNTRCTPRNAPAEIVIKLPTPNVVLLMNGSGASAVVVAENDDEEDEDEDEEEGAVGLLIVIKLLRNHTGRSKKVSSFGSRDAATSDYSRPH